MANKTIDETDLIGIFADMWELEDMLKKVHNKLVWAFDEKVIE